MANSPFLRKADGRGLPVERARADARRDATASLGAGLAYFAVVFAAGFVLGTLRVLVVAPHLGEIAAVVAELPIMLAVSWIICGWLLGRVALRADRPDRSEHGHCSGRHNPEEKPQSAPHPPGGAAGTGAFAP